MRGKDLVGRQHQGGPLQFLDHLGHGEGLARSGHAQQHLRAFAFAQGPHQFGDSLGLIARRFIFADDAQPLAAQRFFGPGGLVRNELSGGVGFFQPPANDEFCHGR